MDNLLDAPPFGWVAFVVHYAGMEVAVANVSKYTGKETQVGQFFRRYFWTR